METKFEIILEEIKKRYQFQTDNELLTLLEGLGDSESKGVTYWDYIEVDTLLSLQKGKTNFPDEIIFITYHQICELYFKLIIQELEKISLPEKHGTRFIDTDTIKLWKTVLSRVIRYMNILSDSFTVMKDGLDNTQFSVFRKSLLPASGFQTYQFRLIEIMLTPYQNLIMETEKEFVKDLTDFDEIFDYIYWRSGAIEKTTGKRAKILVNFNNKYDVTFKEVIQKINGRTLYTEFLKLDVKEELTELMFELDKSILKWKLSHYAAATKHLPDGNKGTGGTKWDEYLPVKRQKINYFPSIWEGKNFNAEIDLMMENIK